MESKIFIFKNKIGAELMYTTENQNQWVGSSPQFKGIQSDGKPTNQNGVTGGMREWTEGYI